MLNYNKLQKLQGIINHDNLKKFLEIVKKRPAVSAAGIMVLVLLVWGIISLLSGESAESSIPTYTVKKGPLRISVTESGTIQPKDKIIIKNQVEGQTTIVYLVDEGTKVKKDDLIMELDSSSLSDKKVDQEIQVQNASASNIDATENYEVAKNQAQSDIDQARLNYDFAQLDLKKYLEGEYPNQLKQAESDITLAEEELATAKDTLEWSRKLYEEKYLSQTELNKDELSYNQKELTLELKKRAKDLLENYTYKRQLAKLESDVSQAKSALERVTRKAKANIAQAEANKSAKQAGYEQQVAKLLKYKSQIEKTKIYALADGTIIYATSAERGQSHFGGRTEPLKVGNTVRERQELIHLPTTSGFVVNISIPESSLDKVKVGLPAQVTVDTIPNLIYTGTVTSVATVVNATNAFMNPDLKTYDTVITLQNGGNMDLLRSGMSCKAEIIIDQYQDAVYIPVQAVMSVNGKPTAYMVKGDKLKPRTVETGLDNNIVIRITSGLEPGEVVSLSPPLAQAAVVEQIFEKLSDVTSAPAANTTSTQGNENTGASSGTPAGGPVQDNSQSQGLSQGGNNAPPSGDFISRFDKDNDGRISKSEFQGPENFFSQLDKNGDGYISKDEAPQGRQGSGQDGRQGGSQGENQGSETRYSTTGPISDSDSSSDSGGLGGPPGDFGGGGPGGGGPGGGPGGF